MKYHVLCVSLIKQPNFKLSSAANYRWRFKGQCQYTRLIIFHFLFGIEIKEIFADENTVYFATIIWGGTRFYHCLGAELDFIMIYTATER